MKWFVAALLLMAGCSSPDPLTGPPLAAGDWDWHVAFDGFAQPVGLVEHPDGFLLVIEQAGHIRQTDGTLWFDLSAQTTGSGERGLLGLDFGHDRMYASYTDLQGDSVVSFFPLNAGNPGAETILLTVEQPFGNHNGGHIIVKGDYLYLGLGDGGLADDPENNGQNRMTLLGSILKLDVSGASGYTIPPDNPFVDDPLGADEILHYGLRNPWRFSFDPDDNLWIGDVGQNAWEEVSFARAADRGLNFGWNAYEGSHQYRGIAFDHTPPVTEYANANGDCSITGGHVYTGSNQTLQGWYLFGDFCTGIVRGYHADTGESRVLFETGKQISSFANIQDVSYLIHYGGTIYAFEAQ